MTILVAVIAGYGQEKGRDPMPALEQRLTIITLGVSDLKASEAFYSHTFGWTKTAQSTDDIVFYQLNGIQLALYPRAKLAEDARQDPAGSGFGGFTLAHNAKSEKEVDEIFAGLKNAGAAIIKSPEKVFWGGYSGYVADPDRYLWEIAFNPYLPLDARGNVK